MVPHQSNSPKSIGRNAPRKGVRSSGLIHRTFPDHAGCPIMTTYSSPWSEIDRLRGCPYTYYSLSSLREDAEELGKLFLSLEGIVGCAAPAIANLELMCTVHSAQSKSVWSIIDERSSESKTMSPLCLELVRKRRPLPFESLPKCSFEWLIVMLLACIDYDVGHSDVPRIQAVGRSRVLGLHGSKQRNLV